MCVRSGKRRVFPTSKKIAFSGAGMFSIFTCCAEEWLSENEMLRLASSASFLSRSGGHSFSCAAKPPTKLEGLAVQERHPSQIPGKQSSMDSPRVLKPSQPQRGFREYTGRGSGNQLYREFGDRYNLFPISPS